MGSIKSRYAFDVNASLTVPYGKQFETEGNIIILNDGLITVLGKFLNRDTVFNNGTIHSSLVDWLGDLPEGSPIENRPSYMIRVAPEFEDSFSIFSLTDEPIVSVQEEAVTGENVTATIRTGEGFSLERLRVAFFYIAEHSEDIEFSFVQGSLPGPDDPVQTSNFYEITFIMPDVDVYILPHLALADDYVILNFNAELELYMTEFSGGLDLLVENGIESEPNATALSANNAHDFVYEIGVFDFTNGFIQNRDFNVVRMGLPVAVRVSGAANKEIFLDAIYKMQGEHHRTDIFNIPHTRVSAPNDENIFTFTIPRENIQQEWLSYRYVYLRVTDAPRRINTVVQLLDNEVGFEL